MCATWLVCDVTAGGGTWVLVVKRINKLWQCPQSLLMPAAGTAQGLPALQSAVHGSGYLH